MSGAHRVLVLRKELSGESYQKLHLLGPELGLRLCLKRVATKTRSLKTAPDLFDTADIQTETSKHGTAEFVGDYQLLVRRDEIGRNYRSLRYASELSNLLILNGGHMADLPTLFELTERSLDAFAEGREPSVVYLKSLYLLLKDEGYPVRESWWAQFPAQLRESTRRLLNEPSPAELTHDARESCEAAIRNLLQWLLRETDLSLPDGVL